MLSTNVVIVTVVLVVVITTIYGLSIMSQAFFQVLLLSNEQKYTKIGS